MGRTAYSSRPYVLVVQPEGLFLAWDSRAADAETAVTPAPRGEPDESPAKSGP